MPPNAALWLVVLHASSQKGHTAKARPLDHYGATSPPREIQKQYPCPTGCVLSYGPSALTLREGGVDLGEFSILPK